MSSVRYYQAEVPAALDGSEYTAEINGAKVNVFAQYVYTDDKGNVCAAPLDEVRGQQLAAAGYSAPNYSGSSQVPGYTAPAGADAGYTAADYSKTAAEAAVYTAPDYSAPAAVVPGAAASAVLMPGEYVLAGAPSSYAAPVVDKVPETGTPRRRFVRTCNRVGGAMWLYVLVSSVVSLAVMALWAGASSFESILANGGSMDGLTDELTNAQYPAMLFAGLAAGLVCAFALARMNGFKALSVYGKASHVKGLNLRAYFIGFGAVGAWAMIYSVLCSLIPGLAMPSDGLSGVPTEPLYLACYVIYTVIIAPIVEEFIFRGVVFKSLSRYGVVFAAVANSLLFGLLHGNLAQAPFAFAVGLVFSYCTMRTGSIWLSTALHFGVNFLGTGIGVAEALLPDYVDVIDTGFVCIYLAFAVIGLIVLLVNKKKIGWITENTERCRCLLPYEWDADDETKRTILADNGEYIENTPVRRKGLLFVTAFAILTFIIYSLFSFFISTGYGMEIYTDAMSQLTELAGSVTQLPESAAACIAAVVSLL